MTKRPYVLRRVQARNAQWVTATYAVLVSGEVVGHVDKYEQTMQTVAGVRGGRGQRSRTDVCWGWRIPGRRDDPSGFDRRSDAVGWLLHELNVPRETKEN